MRKQSLFGTFPGHLKQCIGTNIAAPQFLQILSCLCCMGMVVFASFFAIFILDVELCMRQVVPFSLGQNGQWILFLLRKTCTECFRPTGSFLRPLLFSSHIPCQAFFFFFPASFASFSFIWVLLLYDTSKRNFTRKFPIVLNHDPS